MKSDCVLTVSVDRAIGEKKGKSKMPSSLMLFSSSKNKQFVINDANVFIRRCVK